MDLIQSFTAAWDLFNTSMTAFLSFIEQRKPVSLKNTENVLTSRLELVKHIGSLRERVQAMQGDYEFEESYKEKVPIDLSKAKEATCCSVCEENCHYPGCWWVSNLSWCSVMSKNHCTVCPGKCHFSEHVKGGKIYEKRTRKVKKTLEDVKKNYQKKSEDNKRLIRQLEEERTIKEKEITGLVKKCQECIHILQIAQNPEVLSALQDLDLLCKEAKETLREDIVQKPKDLKNEAEKKSNQARH